jgi:hypothetical protein
MQYDGKLSISRVSNSHNSYISIQLQDANACVRVVDIEVPIELFGDIITGLGAQPVKFEAGDFSKIGKTMEFKTEQVVANYKNSFNKSEVTEALKSVIPAYEIDGWIAEIESSLNRQKSTGTNEDGQNYVNVHFRRWI